ncbi:MAG: hypothetical protein A2498_09335 [Lentisphaerae bacterium RIFOXYC12_FULL_60_16]|nr:MAG: hypothetical protein A2498_09335 [Lentisphaerae bacterium RIFOXYC12_FULL_60_16]OGV71762.1 MAG: hypothetical protein A2269_07640 [Lentisphaerae bacterium RIFOXYA12_FULL_60_10]OGV78186.1 MAG: hypothetical protein A2340_09430 [Lentisphaerae bacterium RIFOXYB12_FULL_60_10]
MMSRFVRFQLRYGFGALLLVTVFFAGCSQQDFGRSVLSPLTDVVDSGKAYVQQRQDEQSLERSRNLAKALADWRMESTGQTPDYHLGPDDILDIGVLSLNEPGQVGKLLRTIATDGSITLPWIGSLVVGGLVAREAEARVRQAYDGRYLKNPEVTLVVSQFRSAPVVVTGAVAKPGMYYLTRDRRTLLEILAEADGVSSSAGDELMIIRKRPAPSTNVVVQADETNGVAGAGSTNLSENLVVISIKKLIDEGDLSLNVPITGGDLITVLPRQKDFVYVLGYVGRPGAYAFDPNIKMGPMQYVAMAAGLTSAARAENCFLVRQTAEGQRMIPFDLTKIMRGARPPFTLEAGDTMVVGSSLLSKLSEFIRPSVSAGMSYAPGAP